MTDDQMNTLQKLRDMGATRIEVKPDGTVVAEFGSSHAPVFVPQPYPVYPNRWWDWPVGPIWVGDPNGTVDSAGTSPKITWSIGDSCMPSSTFTEWHGEADGATYCPHTRVSS